MDHEQAVRSMTAEKYLLNELSPEERESFEQHFFSCAECASDVEAGTALVEGARGVFNAPAQPAFAPAAAARPAWFRLPAIAFGALALLILSIFLFQNARVIPRMKSELAQAHAPRALASYSLITGNSRGDSLPVLTPPPGEPFILFIDIPASANSAGYIAKLYSSSGRLEHTFPLSRERVKDTVSLLIPPVTSNEVFTLVVEETAPPVSADNIEVLRHKFEVRPLK